MVAAISLVVFLILSVLQPFNIGQRNINGSPYITALVYAGGAALTMCSGVIWLALFPQWFAPQRWTLGKDLIVFVYQLISIGFTIWAINSYRALAAEQGYGRAIFLVFAIGILPYALLTFIKHNRYLQQSLREAEQMNHQLKRLQEAHLLSAHSNSTAQTITSYLILPKQEEQIPVTRFLFAESKGNNLHIHWLNGEQPHEIVIRHTINEFAANNAAYTSLFRCHRSYIVNLEKIQQVKGNAAGYQLVMHSYLPPVTVARSYVGTFRNMIS